MGTKAVFAIGNDFGKEDFYPNPIIGMTMDGFPQNLDDIAQKYLKTAKSLRLSRARAAHPANITKIAERMIEKEPGWSEWLFLDDFKNAQWVSHSAIFYPKTGFIHHYDGKLEDLIETKKIGLAKT